MLKILRIRSGKLKRKSRTAEALRSFVTRHNLNNAKLPLNFYERPVLLVAEELLGKIFVKSSGGEFLAAKIVEVEAYCGKTDESAHSFRGMTKRNEVMFHSGGRLYVYFTYGAHYCCNIVTGDEGEGDAVLLRAMEPISGFEEFCSNRYPGKISFTENDKKNLMNGPGKLSKAFGINLNFNGCLLDRDKIYILDNKKIKTNKIERAKRIGITKSTDLLWRFYIKDNPFVSKK